MLQTRRLYRASDQPSPLASPRRGLAMTPPGRPLGLGGGSRRTRTAHALRAPPGLSAHRWIAEQLLLDSHRSLPACGGRASCARVCRWSRFVCRFVCTGCPSSPPWRSPPLSVRRCALAAPPFPSCILATYPVASREQPSTVCRSGS